MRRDEMNLNSVVVNWHDYTSGNWIYCTGSGFVLLVCMFFHVWPFVSRTETEMRVMVFVFPGQAQYSTTSTPNAKWQVVIHVDTLARTLLRERKSRERKREKKKPPKLRGHHIYVRNTPRAWQPPSKERFYTNRESFISNARVQTTRNSRLFQVVDDLYTTTSQPMAFLTLPSFLPSFLPSKTQSIVWCDNRTVILFDYKCVKKQDTSEWNRVGK